LRAQAWPHVVDLEFQDIAGVTVWASFSSLFQTLVALTEICLPDVLRQELLKASPRLKAEVSGCCGISRFGRRSFF
jgi:hypothetical protein